MQTEWIRTDKIYHQIIDAPDMATRENLYEEQLMQPWQNMMTMFAGASEERLAGARAWNWLLPEQLTTPPPSLIKLEEANIWEIGGEGLAQAANRFAAYEQAPIDHARGFLILADPEKSDPVMKGYTGGTDWTQPQFAVQVDTVTDENLPCIKGAVVHEFHHLIRLRVFPFDMVNTSVADYIIHEGMAESFASSLFGESVVGHYVTEVQGDDLARAKGLIGEALDKTGFNIIRGYIFGDHWGGKMGIETVGGMPNYGGYAVGYHVVQAFLKKTGIRIEEATFMPADEIITQSGYFDTLY